MNGIGKDGMMHSNGSGTKVELILSARGLANADTFSKSDPFCVVEEVYGPEKSVEIERTECIQNCLNPWWQTKILLDHSRLKDSVLRFTIYDSDSDARALTFHDFLGRCHCRLSDILSAPNGSLFLRLKKDRDVFAKGQLHLHAEKFEPEGETMVSFECRGLLSSPNKRWALKPNIAPNVPSAYLEFFRLAEDQSKEMLMVHRTKTMPNTWNPEWPVFQVSLRHLCQGNLDRVFLIHCYTRDTSGNPQLVGIVETTVNLLTVGRQWRVELVNEGKRLKKRDIYKTEGHLHFIHVRQNKPKEGNDRMT